MENVNAEKPRKSRELWWREIAKHIARLVSPTGNHSITQIAVKHPNFRTIELPNITGKNVSVLYPLRPGCFAIMCTRSASILVKFLTFTRKEIAADTDLLSPLMMFFSWHGSRSAFTYHYKCLLPVY